MNHAHNSIFNRPSIFSAAFSAFVLTLLLAAGTVVPVLGQGTLPTGTIGNTGTGPYTYNLTFSDPASATSPIGSIWYAWVPGFFYLPGTPTSASAPAGWTATIFANSVQFVANSAANDITAGSSLSGFSYTATFTPAQLAAAANSGRSVAYIAGLQGDPGRTFTVQPIPEPSMFSVLVLGATALMGYKRRANAL
jgi:hypothetical protein